MSDENKPEGVQLHAALEALAEAEETIARLTDELDASQRRVREQALVRLPRGHGYELAEGVRATVRIDAGALLVTVAYDDCRDDEATRVCQDGVIEL